MRFVDLSPVEISMAARSHQIELAIVQSTEAPGPQWEIVEIGVMRWAFYARKDHPVLRVHRGSESARSGSSASTHAPIGLTKLKQLAIVQNCFYEGTRINESNRFLPLKVKTSKLCHSSETTATALSIVKSTDQIAFLPVIAVPHALRGREIVELELGEAESARQAAENAEIAQKLGATQSLYLAYHTERVSQSLRDQLVRRLRAELQSLGG
jgi:DNA-binding transcriptional LysR family regulator